MDEEGELVKNGVREPEQEKYYDGWHAEKQDWEDVVLDEHEVLGEDVVWDENVVLEEDVVWDERGVSQEDVVLKDDAKDQML